ncbi:MAG TPA: EAL domain-containing protein [Burkholderiaceae bacterium]|nr:EAL domain-containing protein [Burkholderiaceae bacterium]
MIGVDARGAITLMNRAAEQLLAFARRDAIGLQATDVVALDPPAGASAEGSVPELDALVQRVTRERGTDRPLRIARTIRCRDGSRHQVELSIAPSQPGGEQILIVIHRACGGALVPAGLSHFAHHDVLTGLPNRMLLEDRAASAIAIAKRRGHRVALLFLDLDRFKQTNDTLGHAAGDQLLRSVSKRLLECVRGSDTVCRLGGDEFVVLLGEVAHRAGCETTARKILRSLAAPHRIGEHSVEACASIGISVYPDDADSLERLLEHADLAMYRAKHGGRNTFRHFEQSMLDQVRERRQMEAALQSALARGEFELHYQPRVELSSGAVNGAEALLRWRHPEQGLLPAARFVPLANEIGAMPRIGEWVVRQACHQVRRWRDAGVPPVPVTVNVGASELCRRGFVQCVAAALDAAGIAGGLLEFDVGERALTKDPAAIAAALRDVASLGVRVSIDDFGTGYSSVSYLRSLPIAALKIDASLIAGIGSEPGPSDIVAALAGVGHSLTCRVGAEGVERDAQLLFLRSHRCTDAQGLLFGAPMPAAELERTLRQGVRWQPAIAPPAPARSAPPTNAVARDRRAHRVLIIEDDLASADLLIYILQAMGFEATAVHDGGDALLAARAYRPDLIITDIDLPRRNGFALAEDFRRDPLLAAIPVVAVTGCVDTEARGMTRARFSRYLQKPIGPEVLLDAIRTLLDRSATAAA